jgi:hypothetical protein
MQQKATLPRYTTAVDPAHLPAQQRSTQCTYQLAYVLSQLDVDTTIFEAQI